MEFDKSKILTVVTADQAKIGMKGWFAENIEELRKKVDTHKTNELLNISYDESDAEPFRSCLGMFRYSLFYPAPEPTYAERQAEWIKENGLKVGDEVWITRPWEAGEDGADCAACYRSSGLVGAVVNVKEIREKYILIEESVFYTHRTCPYTALGIIKEPTYRPFNNDELNDLVGKVLIQKHTGNAMLIINVVDGEIGKMVSLGGRKKRNAQQLLEGWTFKDGNPCGVKEAN